MKTSRRQFGRLLIGAALTAGCGEAVDPQTLALRRKFLTTEPLPGERPIPEIRKDLKDGKLTADATFTVRARINAGDFPPFGNGQASFLITDATGHDGDENHNPHECPFCKRDINSVMARVEFPDESGSVVKTDARDLLQVREMDLVLIEGRGRIDEKEDMLVLTASKIFVKVR
jgi:hypothetical protein